MMEDVPDKSPLSAWSDVEEHNCCWITRVNCMTYSNSNHSDIQWSTVPIMICLVTSITSVDCPSSHAIETCYNMLIVWDATPLPSNQPFWFTGESINYLGQPMDLHRLERERISPCPLAVVILWISMDGIFWYSFACWQWMRYSLHAANTAEFTDRKSVV